MKISVRNFRGLKAAELENGPVFLIAGNNAVGKSSLAQAVAACLTGKAIEDSFELRKSDIKDLIRDGSTVATVDIVTDAGSAKMVYPDAKLSTVGDAPKATLFAAGLLSIPTMPHKERAFCLAPYLKADPDLTDLRGALTEEFDEETISRCWDVLKRDGWDATHKSLEDKRARARASWEQITGESFGSAKAKTWRPDGWSDNLFGDVTIEELTRRRDEAKAAIDRAIGAAAIEVADIGKLRELADRVDELRLGVDEAKNNVATIAKEKEIADNRFFNMPLPENFPPMECPHCHGKVRLRSAPSIANRNGSTLEKAEALDAEENKRRRMLVAEIEGARANVTGRLNTAQKELAAVEQRYSDAQAAKEKVAAAEGQGEGAQDDAEKARADLRTAETDLLRLQRKQEAEAAFQRWEANDKFCLVLGPGPQGLRAKKLAEATLLFNSQILAPLCAAAGWDRVEITEDFRVTLGGRIFSLLSDSDQMRTRIVLQVAMAKIDGSSMIVIDRAEALDAENKKKLMTLLIDCGIHSLVCMVVPNPKAVPDLKRAGYGETLWIDQGEAKPLAAVA